MLGIFRLLNRLKKDSLLWAIFESAECKIETTKSPDLVAYAKPDKKGFKIVLSEALLQNETWDFQYFVLCHEIMHIYFSHFNLVQDDRTLDNIAKDFAINYFLSEYLRFPLTTSFKGVSQNFVYENFGLSLDVFSDSYHVYQELVRSKKENGEQEQKGQNFCKTDANDLNPSQKETDAFSENLEKSNIDLKDLKKLSEIESKMTANQKGQGSQGQSLARPLIELREGKPSLEVAKILLRRAVANTQSKINQKRSSRRDETIPGRTKLKQNKVCFIVDTSGSMSDDDLKIISDIIDYSSKTFEVTIRCGDTDLKNQKVLKRGQKISPDFFIGGGGTDLNFAKQENDKFLHYLIFTDGQIPKFKENFARTFFILEGYRHLENEKCFTLKK